MMPDNKQQKFTPTFLSRFAIWWGAAIGFFEPITSLVHHLLIHLGYFQQDSVAPYSWSTGMTFDAFPVSLRACGHIIFGLVNMLFINYVFFSRYNPVSRFMFLLTERLIILVGFGFLVIFYCQFHLIQSYFFVTVLVPTAWFEVESSSHWIVVLHVILMGTFRILAIYGLSIAAFYAFVPITKSLSLVWLMFRPYFVHYSDYLKLSHRVERLMSPPGRCDLLLASDLHIESGGGTLEGGLTCGSMLSWFKRLRGTCQAKGLLLLGDTTDTGDTKSWRLANDFLSKLQIERAVVPGNHDVHFKRIAEHLPGLTWAGNWWAILNQSQEDSNTENIGILNAFLFPYLWPKFFKKFGGTNNSFSTAAVSARINEVEGRTNGGRFPRLHRYKRIPVDVLLIDSNKRESGWPVTNAVGLIGEVQLNIARSLLAERNTDRILLFALHHHIIPPISLAAPLLVCLDYLKVLDLAIEFGAEAIIYGHTHMPYVCKIKHKSKVIKIISCGSPLFDASGPLAKIIHFPSCFGLRVENGRLKDEVLLFTRAPDPTAKPEQTANMHLGSGFPVALLLARKRHTLGAIFGLLGAALAASTLLLELNTLFLLAAILFTIASALIVSSSRGLLKSFSPIIFSIAGIQGMYLLWAQSGFGYVSIIGIMAAGFQIVLSRMGRMSTDLLCPKVEKHRPAVRPSSYVTLSDDIVIDVAISRKGLSVAREMLKFSSSTKLVNTLLEWREFSEPMDIRLTWGNTDSEVANRLRDCILQAVGLQYLTDEERERVWKGDV